MKNIENFKNFWEKVQKTAQALKKKRFENARLLMIVILIFLTKIQTI